jgi:hypothetical protein
MRPTDVVGDPVKVVLRVTPFSGHGLLAMFDKTTARVCVRAGRQQLLDRDGANAFRPSQSNQL